MATYYIDPVDGSDLSADPTNIATPWKTWGKVNSASAYSGGNVYAQKTGTTNSGALVLNASGSAGSLITITSYDPDGTIPGVGTKPIVSNTSSGDDCFGAYQRHHFAVSWLSFNQAASTNKDGMGVDGCYDFSITDCDIDGDAYGINGGSTAANEITNAVISRNDITHKSGTWANAGIFLYSLSATQNLVNVTISDNEIHDCNYGMHLPVSAYVYNFQNLVVTGNEVYNCSKVGIFNYCNQDVVAESALISTNCRFDNNHCYNNASQGLTCGPFTGGSVSGNRVHDNCASSTTGGLQVSGLESVTIANNVTYNNHTNSGYDGVGLFLDIAGTVGASAGKGCKNCKVFANVSYDNDDYGGTFAGWTSKAFPPSSGICLYRAESCLVTGNICHDNGAGIALHSSCIDNTISLNTCADNVLGIVTTVQGKGNANIIRDNVLDGNDYSVYDADDGTLSTTGNLTLSAVTGEAITITDSASEFTGRANYYIWESAGTGCALIYAVASGTSCSARVLRNFADTTRNNGTWVLGLHTDAMSMYNYNIVNGTTANYKTGDSAPANDSAVDPALSSDYALGNAALKATATWKAGARASDDLPLPLHPDPGAVQDRTAPGRRFGVGGGVL